eukprot:2321368-Prymnesium_polylepis.2
MGKGGEVSHKRSRARGRVDLYRSCRPSSIAAAKTRGGNGGTPKTTVAPAWASIGRVMRTTSPEGCRAYAHAICREACEHMEA